MIYGSFMGHGATDRTTGRSLYMLILTVPHSRQDKPVIHIHGGPKKRHPFKL